MNERILIVRLSHLGDVVHALPAFHALRAARPDARLAWAIQPEFAPLVEKLPGLERTFLFARRAGLRAWTDLRRELSSWQPDRVVDAQGNTKSAMVALTSGAPRRQGLAHGDWREGFSAHAMTDTAAPARGPHAMDRTLALVEHLVPGIDASRVRIDPGLDPHERDLGRALLTGRGPGGEAPEWILNLADPTDLRSWPPAQFEALARTLAGAGRRVLVLSGPAEAGVGEELAARLEHPRVAHWVAQRGLRELAALFAAAAEAGARLVACDSGPAHLAASVGLPVELLAGPQDPLRTGPWPSPTRGASPHRFHRNPEQPDCAPCLKRRCVHPLGAVCLSGLEATSLAAHLLNGSAAPVTTSLSSPTLRA